MTLHSAELRLDSPIGRWLYALVLAGMQMKSALARSARDYRPRIHCLSREELHVLGTFASRARGPN